MTLGSGSPQEPQRSSIPVYIGDEISAAGYRLAGVRALTPAPERVAAVLREARESAELILLSAEYARMLPGEVVNEAVSAISPMVMVVSDPRGRFPTRDLPRRLRRELGV